MALRARAFARSARLFRAHPQPHGAAAATASEGGVGAAAWAEGGARTGRGAGAALLARGAVGGDSASEELMGAAWYYKDDEGVEWGPFSCEEVRGWHRQGYFQATVPFRREGWPRFLPLSTLLRQWGPGLWTLATSGEN